MTRKVLLFFSLLLLTAMGLLAWLVFRASPGPASQDILGVAVGQYESEKGIVFLSGRRLDCTPDAEPPYTSTCTVKIAGELLTLKAFRNDSTHSNQLGGGCQAIYDGQTWPCKIASRHVHVAWFAYIEDPLGLNATQMETLRRRYFFENLPEEPFLVGVMIAPFVVTGAVLVGLFAWRRPYRKRAWIMAVGLGFVLFSTTFVFAFRLIDGFWD